MWSMRLRHSCQLPGSPFCAGEAAGSRTSSRNWAMACRNGMASPPRRGVCDVGDAGRSAARAGARGEPHLGSVCSGGPRRTRPCPWMRHAAYCLLLLSIKFGAEQLLSESATGDAKMTKVTLRSA